MIKYKVTQVTGNKNQIEENESKYFDDLDSARKNFDSVDIYGEMLKDWTGLSQDVRAILISQDAFLEYDLIECDTDDESYKIILGRKSLSFFIFL